MENKTDHNEMDAMEAKRQLGMDEKQKKEVEEDDLKLMVYEVSLMMLQDIGVKETRTYGLSKERYWTKRLRRVIL